MKSLKKKVLTGLLSGVFVFGAAGLVAAAPSEGAPPVEEQQVDLNALAKEIAGQYGVNQAEVRKALGEERAMDDIYYAAILAKACNRSFAEVISMKADWFEVMKKLGMTREKYMKTVRGLEAQDIASRVGIKESEALKLLEEHYHPRDIRIAGRLAQAAKKDIRSVLAMKTLNKRWIDVAEDLKVDRKLIMPRSPLEEQEDKDANEANDANVGEK